MKKKGLLVTLGVIIAAAIISDKKNKKKDDKLSEPEEVTEG